jgi:predicted permease
MDSVLADLRYAVRNIARRPGFAALAVLTLAIGVGVNAVAFTAVNGLLFHPFVFKEVNRLGWIMLATPGNAHGELSYAEFGDLKRHARAFDALAAQGRQPLALIADGRAEQIWTLLVSADYFRALDTRAAMGRVLDASDVSRDDLAAVVSYRFWQSRLHGESIAGRTVTIANRSVTIVGVLPDGYQGANGLFAPDVWLSLERADAFGLPRRLLTHESRWLGSIARLAPGIAAAQADAELAAIGAQLAPQPPDPAGTVAAERRLAFFPMRDGHPEVQSLAPYVWIAMSVVGIVLLIACFNVAGLLLARATERQREFGIRTALGAGRLRIVRQLVTEGLVLAALSGCAALILASWSGTLLAAFSLPAPIPQRLEMPVGGRVVLFTVLMVVAAGVLPGLAPALQATRRNLVGSMRIDAGASGRRPSRLRNLIVVVQIAGSTLFLATALLFVRSFLNANRADVGFDADHLIVARLDPALYGFDGDRAGWFARQLADRVAAVPGLVVALGDRVPFAVGYPPADTVSTRTLDCSGSCKPTTYYSVGARHFAAVGIRLRAGRDFTAAELQSGGAVIVNESMAAALWPGRSSLGEVVRLGRGAVTATVVGVAANIGQGYVGQTASPVFYQPIRDADFRNGFTLAVRTTGSDALAAAAIRDAVHGLAPAMPIASLTTMKELLDLPLWPRRTAAGFFLICGSLALVLATVGLFGVTYFAVRQRTREFGVRIALGARASDVVRQVLKEGVWLAVPGAALGLVAAAMTARVLARALLGVGAVDPVSFAATAAIEMLVALLACALPALRATQADPMIALRDDN